MTYNKKAVSCFTWDSSYFYFITWLHIFIMLRHLLQRVSDIFFFHMQNPQLASLTFAAFTLFLPIGVAVTRVGHVFTPAQWPTLPGFVEASQLSCQLTHSRLWSYVSKDNLKDSIGQARVPTTLGSHTPLQLQRLYQEICGSIHCGTTSWESFLSQCVKVASSLTFSTPRSLQSFSTSDRMKGLCARV